MIKECPRLLRHDGSPHRRLLADRLLRSLGLRGEVDTNTKGITDMGIFRRLLYRMGALTVGTHTVLASGVLVTPVTAQAAPPGRVCMLLAPQGAYGHGHAAFAVKVRGEANHWIYGSFGSSNDGPMAGWINGGTWQKARARFVSVRDRDNNNARYF